MSHFLVAATATIAVVKAEDPNKNDRNDNKSPGAAAPTVIAAVIAGEGERITRHKIYLHFLSTGKLSPVVQYIIWQIAASGDIFFGIHFIGTYEKSRHRAVRAMCLPKVCILQCNQIS